ncbi:MAG TPA: outer membrane protein assembly factor BamD [Nannocystaceae bacterium]|nr:outer membrane protein assembly factor BamD [Nannocystaceae bacterium]
MSCALLLALGLSIAPVAPGAHGPGPGIRVPQRTSTGAVRKVKKPTKVQLAKKHHKALRAKKIGKRPKVAFTPCSSSLPKQAPRPTSVKAGREGLVANKFYLWPNGTTLNVHFTDGSMEARKAVAEVAVEWTKHANLKLEFFFDENAPPPVTHIRVRFDDPGCNSALGSSSQYAIDAGDASMRLCYMDRRIGDEWFQRVVLHEFGHAIGMEHEHQSPKAHFDWDKPFVYKYYKDTSGWDAAYVDQWVFRQIEAETVDASDYDPDSVMQYSFPAEFTKDRRAILGSFALSPMDKEWAAKIYPREPKKDPKPKAKKKTRFYERAIAVRNGTGVPLDVQLVQESLGKGGWAWKPKASVAAASTFHLEVGQELALAGAQGRKVKLVARTGDGKKTWSAHGEKPVVIATKGGYVDRELQTWVVTIDGPADPSSLDRDALYSSGSTALDAGDWELARARFGEFIAQFPDDEWRPWAELSIVIAWVGERDWSNAVAAAYDLAVNRPGTDAGAYAWYYGGLATMQRGHCSDAQIWFDYVVDASSGLSKEWRDAAKENLAAMKSDPAAWCN